MSKKSKQRKIKKQIRKLIKKSELLQPRLVFKYTLNNYKVYSIGYSNITMAYVGIFDDGKFNYVIIEDIFLKYEEDILKIIHDEISGRGLDPLLNPQLYQPT